MSEFRMKERPEGFLSDKHISHNSEVFNYIKELHDILWVIVDIYSVRISSDLNKNIEYLMKQKSPSPASGVEYKKEYQDVESVEVNGVKFYKPTPPQSTCDVNNAQYGREYKCIWCDENGGHLTVSEQEECNKRRKEFMNIQSGRELLKETIKSIIINQYEKWETHLAEQLFINEPHVRFEKSMYLDDAIDDIMKALGQPAKEEVKQDPKNGLVDNSVNAELLQALEYLAYERNPIGEKYIDTCSETCQQKVCEAISNARKYPLEKFASKPVQVKWPERREEYTTDSKGPYLYSHTTGGKRYYAIERNIDYNEAIDDCIKAFNAALTNEGEKQ